MTGFQDLKLDPGDFFAFSQAAALREMAAARRARGGLGAARTIAIASARPGVGKTTVAANLAVDLQRRGQRVLLVDLTPGASRLARALGVAPRGTLAQALGGERGAGEIAAAGPCGIRVVAAAAGPGELASLTPWQQERLWSSFGELGRGCDLVILTADPGATPALLAASEAVIVTVPSPEAVTEAYALTKLVARRNPGATVHLAVNRARQHVQGHQVANAIVQAARQFLGFEADDLGSVAEDPCVGLAGREGRLVVTAYPDCPAARCLAAMAARLRGPARTPPGAIAPGAARQLAAIVAHARDAERTQLDR